MADLPKRLVITEYDPEWPGRFEALADQLRERVGDDARGIHHIGSTSVPGLAAKDVIDVQITVSHLGLADRWPSELLPGLVRHEGVAGDHLPAGLSMEAADWEKRFWSRSLELHVHVREDGRPNQRYALLFRDYLRADVLASRSYAAVKRSLAAVAPDDWDAYYEVKDPACDLILAGAEHWAARTGWVAPPSDA